MSSSLAHGGATKNDFLKPRILFIDIETAPTLIAAFPPLHETNAVWVERGTYMFGFAAMWSDEKTPKTYFLPDYNRFKRDIHNDKSLCKDLHRILSEAHVAIGHNADSFDLKIIRSRLIIHNFRPLPPIKTVDTLKESRKIGRFDSNRLNALGEATGVGCKIPTKNDLWKRCYHGDEIAFDAMRRYCARDVTLLADYYARIRGWIPNHVNLAALTEKPCCPVCQSNHIQRRGFNLARTKKTPRFQCTSCGNWFSRSQREDRRTRPL